MIMNEKKMMIYTMTLYTCQSALQTIPTVTLWNESFLYGEDGTRHYGPGGMSVETCFDVECMCVVH